MSQRSLSILAVLVVAVLAGWLLTRKAPEPPPPAPKPTPIATVTPIDVVETERKPPPEEPAPRTQSFAEPVDESKLTAEQATAAAARFRKAARFPRTSRPLLDGMDPIARSRSPKVDYDGDARHPEPRLLAYPSITSFEAPGDVVIYAEVVELRMADVVDQDGKGSRERLKQFRTSARSMRGVIQTMDGVVVAPIVFRDDGTHGDAEPNDDFWTARYTPDPDRPRDFRGQYQVIVQAESAKGDTLTASTSFVYSVQIAHLTGHYRDSVVDGNLQIDVEVAGDEAGRVRVEGTLVTTVDAKMLGYAYADADVAPNTTTWIPLTYYGLIFHDMKAPGPYSLFSTMLSTLDSDVAQESDVVPNAHTTKAYRVEEFGSAPFNDPDYMQKAAHYDDLAKSKRGAAQP
jgi:hypothetical protein